MIDVKETLRLSEADKKMKGADPCWKGYEMIGTKKKNGKEVPNCVPKTEEFDAVTEGESQKVTLDQIKKMLTQPGLTDKDKKLILQRLAATTLKQGVAEDVEQVDELNKDTVYSYKKKSEKEEDAAHEKLEKQIKSGDASAANKTSKKIMNRLAGQERAEKRLNSESNDQELRLRKIVDVVEAKKETSDSITELSNQKLSQYVKAANNDASAADKKGNFKRGDKRYSGILKATRKQFDNDAKKSVSEKVDVPEQEPYNNTKLADKFMAAFKKMKTPANVSCKTVGTISTCEDVNLTVDEAAKKDNKINGKKDMKSGEKLSGKQEPIQIEPELVVK